MARPKARELLAAGDSFSDSDYLDRAAQLDRENDAAAVHETYQRTQQVAKASNGYAGFVRGVV